MVGNFDKTSFPPEYLANHGGEFMVGNFGAPRIMVGNLGIPHHAWWGFYAKIEGSASDLDKTVRSRTSDHSHVPLP